MHTTQPDDRSDDCSVAHADRLFQEGLSLHREGRLLQARNLYEQALEVRRRHFDATHMSGVIAHQLGDAVQARNLIGRAIDIDGGVAAAHCNLGNALFDLAQHTAALACYERAIALCASYAEAHNNRGNALRELGRHEEALAGYDDALSLKPGFADAHANRGNLLQDLGRHAAALASYDRALALNADCAAAHRGRGVSLDRLRNHVEAILSYDRALALQPEDADAHNARGNAFRSLGDLAAASAAYDRAIALAPVRADFRHNRGAVLDELGNFPKAIECFAEALRLDPGYPYLPGMLLYLKRRICDWRDDADSTLRLIDGIQKHARVASPFSAVVLTDSPAVQLEAARQWIGDRHPARPDLPSIAPHARRARIRIGYFSADFHDHATAYLMAELFETHDRTRFEVFGFSFGPCRDDAMGRRLRAAFDGFVDVRTLSDQEVALLARQMGIDIALDLKGFTTGNRVDIFAYRAAPVQVNYLGFPGTMGAGYMDYLIADRILIPEREIDHYSEKVVCLPHSYQVNDRRRPISDKIFSREELHLPSSGFVFCCFNNNYKINAATYDGWMRILARVGGSVLWLFEDNALAAVNLRKEAAIRGIDPSRLVFGQRLPLAEHLARHRAADLFLDTAPYNAHTTASDALWSGLPVLTLTGTTFAGRVTTSLLSALDLPELITATSQDYEALAVRLATHPEALAQLSEKLAANRLAKPLFDTPLFTRHLEDAFTQMHERRLQGLRPAPIIVKSDANPN
jgi:predicted O-linked N-acetylglucosamine transferase (SPINDLY family)